MNDIKILLVTKSTTEFERLLKSGWKVAGAYNHAQGALFVLSKRKG
jgi:hypothetical protein